MSSQKPRIFIALGGNLPFNGKQPVTVMQDAITTIGGIGLKLRSVSRLFATPCFPAGAGPDYVNAVAELETPLDAPEILAILHGVEAEFGRERQGRWTGRTLDLDLIAHGDSILPDRATWNRWHDLPPDQQARTAPEQLILPHPRLQDRAFVLVPLMDIAPDWRHPVLGKTVAEMVAALPRSEIDAVRPI